MKTNKKTYMSGAGTRKVHDFLEFYIDMLLKSKMNNAVKYDVYLDTLLMLSIYVIKY